MHEAPPPAPERGASEERLDRLLLAVAAEPGRAARLPEELAEERVAADAQRFASALQPTGPASATSAPAPAAATPAPAASPLARVPRTALLRARRAAERLAPARLGAAELRWSPALRAWGVVGAAALAWFAVGGALLLRSGGEDPDGAVRGPAGAPLAQVSAAPAAQFSWVPAAGESWYARVAAPEGAPLRVAQLRARGCADAPSAAPQPAGESWYCSWVQPRPR